MLKHYVFFINKMKEIHVCFLCVYTKGIIYNNEYSNVSSGSLINYEWYNLFSYIGNYKMNCLQLKKCLHKIFKEKFSFHQ